MSTFWKAVKSLPAAGLAAVTAAPLKTLVALGIGAVTGLIVGFSIGPVLEMTSSITGANLSWAPATSGSAPYTISLLFGMASGISTFLQEGIADAVETVRNSVGRSGEIDLSQAQNPAKAVAKQPMDISDIIPDGGIVVGDKPPAQVNEIIAKGPKHSHGEAIQLAMAEREAAELTRH